MKRKLSLFTFLLILVGILPGQANVIAQEVVTGDADLGSGAGQSFLLPANREVHGVELYIVSGGGSVRVELSETKREDGVLNKRGDTPVASGVLNKDEVVGQTPGWFAIGFGTPYKHTEAGPIELVFVLELLTSGLSGWNDYGFADHNVYSDGSAVYWADSQNGFFPWPDYDLTFRIVDFLEPKPEEQIRSVTPEVIFLPPRGDEPGSLEIRLDEDVEGSEFVLYGSEDINIPLDDWRLIGPLTFDENGLVWKMEGYHLPAKHFFYMKEVSEHE